jgi:hypothetical protein
MALFMAIILGSRAISFSSVAVSPIAEVNLGQQLN